MLIVTLISNLRKLFSLKKCDSVRVKSTSAESHQNVEFNFSIQLCKLFAKKFQKGVDKVFRGCIMQNVKAKASLSVSAQGRYFTFRNPKKILYMKKAMTSLML